MCPAQKLNEPATTIWTNGETYQSSICASSCEKSFERIKARIEGCYDGVHSGKKDHKEERSEHDLICPRRTRSNYQSSIKENGNK